jgi:predicted nuclease of predicted toxin-antitoxin system
MRFLLDQSSDTRLISFLRERRHDATRVAMDYPAGLPDPEVLALAVAEDRILITDDRDFGELVFRLRHRHAGVIFFRLNTTRLSVKINRLNDVLMQHAEQLGEFIVVTQNTVRVRRAQS